MSGEIGCLGNITFSVNDKMVRTFQNMQWSGAARIAEHARHGASPLTEMTGLHSEKITFNMTLTAELGINVDAEIEKVRTHMNAGTQLPLVVGRKAYGRYRWQISNFNTIMQKHDAAGNVSAATITINLIEYLNG